jgi:arginyl-tRNA--protein-N-Asp/Glu arginylyltransferase
MHSYAEFLTDPETCPYLHDRASQLEVRLAATVSPEEHSVELASGVRHFGRSYFRAACPDCSECISLRVPVATFHPSRSQRRVLKKNRDVELELGQPTLDAERLDLYRRFHGDREQRRGWLPSPMDLEGYVCSFVDNPVLTHEFRYRVDGTLVGIAYVDESSDSLNSIFAYHCPEYSRRSLGTFDILSEIEAAAARGKSYLYLGYYVAGCQSMEYKRDFRPYELLVDGKWKPFEE